MTFGAMRLRYSISILATAGGISKANSLRFFTSLADNSKLEIAPRRFVQEQMHVEGKRRKILQPYRHVAEDADRERSLRLDEGPEVRLGVPFHFGPEATRKTDTGAAVLRDHRIGAGRVCSSR